MAPNSSVPVMRDAMISLSDYMITNPMLILTEPNEFVFIAFSLRTIFAELVLNWCSVAAFVSLYLEGVRVTNRVNFAPVQRGARKIVPSENAINKPEAWRFWKERFMRYGRLAVPRFGYSESDWIDLLCYTMGEQSEEIMEQIMPDVDNKSLKDVLQAFTDYFGQMKNVTLQRYRFNSRIQLPNESVEQFITVLRILAESCQYGNMKDELIRDRIVAGLSNTRIMEKLQLESCLTLENTIAIAREVEIQRSQHEEVSQDSSSTGEINCAAKSSDAQQFPSHKNNDSKSSDQESCEYKKCRKTEDWEIGGKLKSVSCARTAKDGQESAEKDNKDCDIRHNQETRSYNCCRLSQLELDDANDEEANVKAVYETMQQVMNDLNPQNFVESVNQIETLEINSEAALQIVVDLIYEKAVDEPSFSVTLALMCQELAMMEVSSHNSEAGKEESNVNFRKLLIIRCQEEFEKNIVDNARAIVMQEIEACADPEKKKELQHILTEDESRIRIKSVGSIRFIGELFKQGMLMTTVMHWCIGYLLTPIDEKNLESLCILLITIGKDLESRNQNLDQYFKQMLDIINRKGSGKVSSRVRFMLQDVVELRLNKWVSRRDYSNSETMDQIQKEAETERLDTQMNTTPLNTPRNDDRNIGNQTDGRTSRNGSQQSGSRSSSRDRLPDNTSRGQSMSMPPPQPIKSNPHAAPASRPNKLAAMITEYQTAERAADILEEYLSDTNIINAALVVRETFDNSTFAIFVRETLTGVVRKSATARKQVGQLMTHLISENILPISLYLVGLVEVLDTVYNPKVDGLDIWRYLAELIWHPLAEGVVPFSELETMIAPSVNKGLAGGLMGELIIKLIQEQGPKWIEDKVKLDPADLEWDKFQQRYKALDDFIQDWVCDREHVYMDDINKSTAVQAAVLIERLHAEMKERVWNIQRSSSDSGISAGRQLVPSMEQIHERLLRLMSNEKENPSENIDSWISVNVGKRASERQFIRVLMTAILEVSIEPYNSTFKFRSDKFHNLQTLISRYIGVSKVMEIQCIIAIQEYIYKLEYPSGVLLQIIEKLWDDSILTYNGFLAWVSNNDLTAITGKSVAIMTLASFFTSLKAPEDESSDEKKESC